jgi:hypothetical protein
MHTLKSAATGNDSFHLIINNYNKVFSLSNDTTTVTKSETFNAYASQRYVSYSWHLKKFVNNWSLIKLPHIIIVLETKINLLPHFVYAMVILRTSVQWQ